MNGQERGEGAAGREQAARELQGELLTRPLDDAAVRSLWQASPFAVEAAWTRELDELLALRARLAGGGREARAVLEAAARGGPVPGEEAVLAFVAERLGPPAARRAVRRHQLLAALAGLAAVALFALWLRGTGAPEAGGGATLGPDAAEVALLEPVGAVAAWEAFRWRARRPLECWYELTVRGPDGRELAHVRDLSATSWRPGDPSAWPARLTWELVAYDADGRVGAWSAEAWRP